MYFITKIDDLKPVGPMSQYGYWLYYQVVYVDPENERFVDLSKINVKVIDEDVAKAWRFAGVVKDYVSVRKNTDLYEQLFLSSKEQSDEKEYYYLTDLDKENGLKFVKAVLDLITKEYYDVQFEKLKKKSSVLEMSTWEEQKREALLIKENPLAEAPVISVLAESRGISKDAFADLVLQNVNEYNLELANLLSKQQVVTQEIKNCQTMRECAILMHNRFGYQVPAALAEEDSIDYLPKFDL